MRRRACLTSLAIALVAGGLACSDPTTPPEGGGRLRMTVLASPALSDTIQAWAPEPFVIVLRGEGGQPLAGVPVRFEAGTADTLRPFERPLFLCRRTVTTCHATSQGGVVNVIDTTDASGQVQVRVRYGTIAGKTFVRVVTWTPGTGVPAEGKPALDSVAFEVRPGAAVNVVAAPADTGIILGGTATVRARVVDRFRNVRPETGDVALMDGPLSPRSAGAFGGAAFGRARLVARFGAFVDTGFVSVLPDGEFAAFDLSRSARLVVQHLDGTILHRWPTGPTIASASGPPPLSWSADGSQIVLGGELDCSGQDGPQFPLQRIVVASGELQPGLREALPFDGCASWGRLSSDGQWLYFGAAPWDEGWSLFRARADGTAIEPVGPARTAAMPRWEGSWRGDPSADGSLVVYQRFGTEAGIEVLDVTAGIVTPSGVSGASPRLSPDGRRFAYVPVGGGDLRLAELASPGFTEFLGENVVVAEHAFGWSADGKWLLVAAEGGVHVVAANTGSWVLVPGTFGLTVPSWRP